MTPIRKFDIGKQIGIRTEMCLCPNKICIDVTETMTSSKLRRSMFIDSSKGDNERGNFYKKNGGTAKGIFLKKGGTEKAISKIR